jgi:hypothetical protein
MATRSINYRSFVIVRASQEFSNMSFVIPQGWLLSISAGMALSGLPIIGEPLRSPTSAIGLHVRLLFKVLTKVEILPSCLVSTSAVKGYGGIFLFACSHSLFYSLLNACASLRTNLLRGSVVSVASDSLFALESI